MVLALEPGDAANPTPDPPPAMVAATVSEASLGAAYSQLSIHGLNTAQSKAVADALLGGVSLDDLLTTARYADLVAQAYKAFAATPSVPLPAAIADWVTKWQAARMAVEGAAGDILLDL